MSAVRAPYYHETRIEELQASFWNVLFRAAVKTCAISPIDPGLPVARIHVCTFAQQTFDHIIMAADGRAPQWPV
jgi:hypothetical protein